MPNASRTAFQSVTRSGRRPFRCQFAWAWIGASASGCATPHHARYASGPSSTAAAATSFGHREPRSARCSSAITMSAGARTTPRLRVSAASAPASAATAPAVAARLAERDQREQQEQRFAVRSEEEERRREDREVDDRPAGDRFGELAGGEVVQDEQRPEERHVGDEERRQERVAARRPTTRHGRAAGTAGRTRRCRRPPRSPVVAIRRNHRASCRSNAVTTPCQPWPSGGAVHPGTSDRITRGDQSHRDRREDDQAHPNADERDEARPHAVAQSRRRPSSGSLTPDASAISDRFTRGQAFPTRAGRRSDGAPTATSAHTRMSVRTPIAISNVTERQAADTR